MPNAYQAVAINARWEPDELMNGDYDDARYMRATDDVAETVSKSIEAGATPSNIAEAVLRGLQDAGAVEGL